MQNDVEVHSRDTFSFIDECQIKNASPFDKRQVAFSGLSVNYIHKYSNMVLFSMVLSDKHQGAMEPMEITTIAHPLQCNASPFSFVFHMEPVYTCILIQK